MCALEKSWFSEGNHVFWYSLFLECLIVHSFLFIFCGFVFGQQFGANQTSGASTIFAVRWRIIGVTENFYWYHWVKCHLCLSYHPKPVPALRGISPNYTAPELLQACWFLLVYFQPSSELDPKEAKPHSHGDILPHFALNKHVDKSEVNQPYF